MIEVVIQHGVSMFYVNDVLFCYVHGNEEGLFDIWISISTKGGSLALKDESDFKTKRLAMKRARQIAREFLERFQEQQKRFHLTEKK